jgi:hypothetical protein
MKKVTTSEHPCDRHFGGNITKCNNQYFGVWLIDIIPGLQKDSTQGFRSLHPAISIYLFVSRWWYQHSTGKLHELHRKGWESSQFLMWSLKFVNSTKNNKWMSWMLPRTKFSRCWQLQVHAACNLHLLQVLMWTLIQQANVSTGGPVIMVSVFVYLISIQVHACTLCFLSMPMWR